MYKYLLCILFGILIFILSNTINGFSIGGVTCQYWKSNALDLCPNGWRDEYLNTDVVEIGGLVECCKDDDRDVNIEVISFEVPYRDLLSVSQPSANQQQLNAYTIYMQQISESDIYSEMLTENPLFYLELSSVFIKNGLIFYILKKSSNIGNSEDDVKEAKKINPNVVTRLSLENLNFSSISETQKNNFSDVNLFGATLNGSDFTNSILRNVDFRMANCSGTNFTNCDLTGADFRDAQNLDKAIFENAILTGTKFTEAETLIPNNNPTKRYALFSEGPLVEEEISPFTTEVNSVVDVLDVYVKQYNTDLLSQFEPLNLLAFKLLNENVVIFGETKKVTSPLVEILQVDEAKECNYSVTKTLPIRDEDDQDVGGVMELSDYFMSIDDDLNEYTLHVLRALVCNYDTEVNTFIPAPLEYEEDIYFIDLDIRFVKEYWHDYHKVGTLYYRCLPCYTFGTDASIFFDEWGIPSRLRDTVDSDPDPQNYIFELYNVEYYGFDMLEYPELELRDRIEFKTKMPYENIKQVFIIWSQNIKRIFDSMNTMNIKRDDLKSLVCVWLAQLDIMRYQFTIFFEDRLDDHVISELISSNEIVLRENIGPIPRRNYFVSRRIGEYYITSDRRKRVTNSCNFSNGWTVYVSDKMNVLNLGLARGDQSGERAMQQRGLKPPDGARDILYPDLRGRSLSDMYGDLTDSTEFTFKMFTHMCLTKKSFIAKSHHIVVMYDIGDSGDSEMKYNLYDNPNTKPYWKISKFDKSVFHPDSFLDGELYVKEFALFVYLSHLYGFDIDTIHPVIDTQVSHQEQESYDYKTLYAVDPDSNHTEGLGLPEIFDIFEKLCKSYLLNEWRLQMGSLESGRWEVDKLYSKTVLETHFNSVVESFTNALKFEKIDNERLLRELGFTVTDFETSNGSSNTYIDQLEEFHRNLTTLHTTMLSSGSCAADV